MSLIKKLAGETAIYGLSSVVGRLLNYLLVPMYTRVFSTEEYGEVGELYAYVGLLMVLFTYRMETGFFRFGTPKADRDRTFSTTSIALLCTTPIFTFLLIFFSKDIATLLQYPQHANLVVILALILAFDTLSAIPFARLRLDSRPWRFAIIKLTNIGLNIGFNLFFLLLCPFLVEKGWTGIEVIYDADIGIGYIFISGLIASTATILMLLPAYFKIKLTFDKALMKRILWYSMPLIVVGIASIANEVLDRALLKWMLPGTIDENEAQLGIYQANYKLAMLISLFTQAFNYAAEPFFFSNAKRADSMKAYAQVAQIFTIFGVIGFLGITFYIDIIKNFIGEEYHGGLGVVPILLGANLFLGIYYNFAIWYKLKDKTVIGMYIALAGAAVTIGLNVWWIPTLGYFGSAWATLICYFTMSVLAYVIGQRYYPVPYRISRMFLYIIVGVAFYIVSNLLRTQVGDGTLLLYLINTVLLGSYVGFIAYLEKSMFLSIFKPTK